MSQEILSSRKRDTMFWDGRATGAILVDPVAEQAQGPFLNPLKQALANSQVLRVKVRKSNYANLFEQVWGGGMADMFPPPEVDQNRTVLRMFPRPLVDNIVAFLKTLSDGYQVQ